MQLKRFVNRTANILFLQIVLGITAWYLSHYNDTPNYPQGRLIFTIIIAGFAIIAGNLLAFLWQKTSKPLLVALDVTLALASFASFGVLTEFDCNDNWTGWEEVFGKRYRDCWRTIEAFAFIGGFFWLIAAMMAHPALSGKYVRRETTSAKRESQISTESGITA